jgi:ERCC4-type nuclease
MDIIVDTREQLPIFKNNVIKYKLEVGDYSTMNLRHTFAIERKSGQDLYGSLIQGHVRFMNEIYRAVRLGIQLVIFVECSYEQFTSKKFQGGTRRAMSCDKLKKILDTTIERRKIEVVWCNSRDVMKRKIKERLRDEELAALLTQELHPSASQPGSSKQPRQKPQNKPTSR